MTVWMALLLTVSPLEQARQAAQATMKALITELSAAMAQGGPLNAIPVCKARAQTILQEVQKETGVAKLKRTSWKIRNPLDRPHSSEVLLLARIQKKLDQQPDLQEYWDTVGTRLRYVRVLRIQDRCLACHGPTEQMDPRVRAMLRNLYPGDEAVGYQRGDVRGILIVEVPLEQGGKP
ncbi:MAG: DUF3365 domain-containing protein [Candidatus Hydrothermae bacterium]|nr:DUF3365 domain-containing protein [Candidatus Hydrothermae bacterium]